MKATEKQELARKRNWALFQLKSTQSNLIRSMKLLGMNVEVLAERLRVENLRIRAYYDDRIKQLNEKGK